MGVWVVGGDGVGVVVGRAACGSNWQSEFDKNLVL